MKPDLPRSFYARSPTLVALELLGKIISHRTADGKLVSGMIVETEAYLGVGDAAAHSARGITPRTRVLFGPPGFTYVYLIYGMHYCLNIVTEKEGRAGCVLVRALEPRTGMTLPSNGPGRLTRALGITLEHNASDLLRGPLRVVKGMHDNGMHGNGMHGKEMRGEKFRIETSPRIGITKSADLPLRFFIAGNSFVSRL